jgi:hypothetical protein
MPAFPVLGGRFSAMRTAPGSLVPPSSRQNTFVTLYSRRTEIFPGKCRDTSHNNKTTNIIGDCSRLFCLVELAGLSTVYFAAEGCRSNILRERKYRCARSALAWLILGLMGKGDAP